MTKVAATQKTSAKPADSQSVDMQKGRKPKKNSQPSHPEQTLGEYAHRVIAKHYQRLVKQEAGVLQDADPECLHQMRVGTRRLRTALQIFGDAVKLPKPARDRSVRALTKVLGKLRDLDVQIAALQEQYRPQLPLEEQEKLDQATALLHKQRVKAFSEVKSALTHSNYQNLKAAYERWIQQPQYLALAQLPLNTVLPDILSPLLSELLLHPGWLVSTAAQSQDGGTVLHELRKTCKHARYQAEFFTDLAGQPFQDWVNELKQIQENLGIVQDTHVLLEILSTHLPAKSELPQLQMAMQQQQAHALEDWDGVRTQYLNAKFRRQLHGMIVKLNT